MKIQTICHCCSSGCSVEFNQDETLGPGIEGIKGVVNSDGFVCLRAAKGFRHIDNPNRLTEPMLKTRMGFRRITFDEAFLLIEEHIKEVKPEENVFFAGARLSNEELYLVQKIARAAVGTNNLNSFHYLGRGEGYLFNSKANIPFAEIQDTQVVYLFGDSLPVANPFVWHLVQQAKREQNVKIVWISQTWKGEIGNVADEKYMAHSLYSFLKLANRNLIESRRSDKLFSEEICLDFSSYNENLLAESIDLHLHQTGTSLADIEGFVNTLVSSGKSAFIFAEEELSGNTCSEIRHMAMLTGKMGRIADGLIAIKESANSQGLIDMGIHPAYGQGGVDVDDEEFLQKTQTTWGVRKLPAKGTSDISTVLNASPRNLFILGEDPIGNALKDKEQMASYISKAEFSVVQDFCLTPTAQLAELVLPATYIFESGGTYTNSQKIIQQVNRQVQSDVEMSGFEQLAAIAMRLGLSEMKSPVEAMLESVMLFPGACSHKQPRFVYSAEDDALRIFKNGALSFD
ncbi:MAG: molybdopterin-dependent oxidoreductase [Bacteroidota bacterium]|nr:molybdopterin-dependent oxidoreductase [Bacteroidota bacterium]